MTTKRQRPGGGWEFVVRRKGLLPRPLYLTFPSEAEGAEYCRRLEILLDRGIVPPEFAERAAARPGMIRDLFGEYMESVSLSSTDIAILDRMRSDLWMLKLTEISVPWCDDWVTGMKRVGLKAPSTIRKHVGALRRCFDWAVSRGILPVNPLNMLPTRFATYTTADAAAVRSVGAEPREDVARDRRLEDGEEVKIRAILGGLKPTGKQRALTLEYGRHLVLLFDLALETGMRLSELYTLDTGQIDLQKRTIFLDRTKNGDKRQVALSSVAIQILRPFLDGQGRLFPWWDGTAASRPKTTSRLSVQFGRVFRAAAASI